MLDLIGLIWICVWVFLVWFCLVVSNGGDFSICLEGENGMEWERKKRIILEYYSLLLFGSFNGGKV